MHGKNGGDPRMFKGSARPTGDAHWPVSAPILPRRVASALNVIRRHVAGRAPPADPGRGSLDQGLGAKAPFSPAWRHGTLAVTGGQRDSVRRDDEARLPVRHQLVAGGRRAWCYGRFSDLPEASCVLGAERARHPYCLLVSSSGGHLLQLKQLEDAWPRRRIWVTFDRNRRAVAARGRAGRLRVPPKPTEM